MAGIAAGASVNYFTNVGLGTDSGLLTAWNFENGDVGAGPGRSEGDLGDWINTPNTQAAETGAMVNSETLIQRIIATRTEPVLQVIFHLTLSPSVWM